MKYNKVDLTHTPRERRDPDQVKNSAGGYVYQIGDIDRARQFLILGSEGGTFYASERDLTKANVDLLKTLARDKPYELLDILIEINDHNLAARHSTVLLGLAVLHCYSPAIIETERTEADGTVKKDQKRHPVRVTIENNLRIMRENTGEGERRVEGFLRTGTHLFEFVTYALMFRRWGSGLRRLVATWYESFEDPDDLAHQWAKYTSRFGWTHRDLLRKSNPENITGPCRAVVGYITHGATEKDYVAARENETLPEVLVQYRKIRDGELAAVDATDLTWEMLPSASLADPDTWRALITNRKLPYTAMLKNLGRMTKIGVFDDPETAMSVALTLRNAQYIKASRAHPFTILTGMKTYAAGHGFRGSLTWTPKQLIVDALDAAFYVSFKNVEPTGKRILVGLDVSASMNHPLMDSNISARTGAVAMSMATVAADPDTTDAVAFTSAGWAPKGQYSNQMHAPTSGIVEVGLSPRRRLDDIINQTEGLTHGATDCALPILWAAAHKKEYDAFCVYSDDETFAGTVQVVDALNEYRRRINPAAKLIVVMMTSTGFTIGDPADPGTLNVVGFDSSAPAVISNFIAGNL